MSMPLTVSEQINIKSKLSAIPTIFHADVMEAYEEKYNQIPTPAWSYEKKREANLYLLSLQDSIPKFTLSDDALERKAVRLANATRLVILSEGLEEALLFVDSLGLPQPVATTETGLKNRLGCEIWFNGLNVNSLNSRIECRKPSL